MRSQGLGWRHDSVYLDQPGSSSSQSVPVNCRPRVSIGLPVYNASRYIADAIESILGQTFRDFELIISDNGSDDETYEICNEFAANDDRVCVSRQTENRGASWNFNEVVRLSAGEYFRWHAHDDLVRPAHLQRCVETLDARPDVVLCHTGVDIIDANGELIERYGVRLDLDHPSPSHRFAELVLPWQRCFPIFGLVRRTVLLRCLPLGSYAHADGVLLAQLGLRGRIAEVDERCFQFRTHAAQSSAQLRRPNRHGGLDIRAYREWYAPGARGRSFPHWRYLWEYERSTWIRLSAGDWIRCQLVVARLARLRIRDLARDVVGPLADRMPGRPPRWKR